MATLAQLRTRITELVYDAPAYVTSTVVDRWINRAIRKLQERRNYRVMRATLSANTTIATRLLVARPADWKEPQQDRPYYRRQFGDTVFMDWLGSEEDTRKAFTYDEATDKGAPRSLWIGNPSDVAGAASIEVYPFPDGLSDWTAAPVGEYRIVIPYWKYLPDLAADGASNWFTDNADDYIEFFGQWRAFRASWDEDGRDGTARAMLREEEKDVWRKNVMEELSGMRGLEPRSDVYAPRKWGRL